MVYHKIWKYIIILITVGVVILAIHDVDKTQDSRSLPTPNLSDTHATRASDGTTAITNKVDDATGAYVSTTDAAIKVNNGTTTLIKLGLQTNGSYAFQFSDSNVPRLLMSSDGIKISKPTFDVTTTADTNLIFNSNYNMFKIVATGTASLGAAAAGGTASTTVTHNLGFQPIVIAHQVAAGGSQMLPISGFDVSTGKFLFACDVEFITSTSFQIWSYAATGGGGFPAQTIKYYLLQETAN